MLSRDLRFFLFSTVLVLMVIAGLPQSHAYAQDCVDKDGKKIECPTKEPPKDPPPGDPGNPPAQDNSSNNQNSSNTVILATATLTPTSTDTPKPTDTKIPTETATRPVVCNCTNANPVAGSQPDPSNPAPVPSPNPAPFSPWLTGLAGILIGLLLGAFGGPAIFGGRTQPIPRPDPAPTGGRASLGNSASEYPVKWETPATGKQDFGNDGSTAFSKAIYSPSGDGESTGFVKVSGTSVEEFNPRHSTAAQVSEVQVRGYDPEHKKEIVGSASPSESFPKSENIKVDDQASVLDNSSQPDLDSGSEHMKKLDDRD